MASQSLAETSSRSFFNRVHFASTSAITSTSGLPPVNNSDEKKIHDYRLRRKLPFTHSSLANKPSHPPSFVVLHGTYPSRN